MQRRAGIHLTFLCSLAGILVAWGSVGAPKTVGLEVDGRMVFRETRQTRIDGLLREAGLTASVADALDPGPAAALTDGSVVRLRRSVPVVLVRNNERYQFTTTAPTVREALAEAGILPSTFDRVLLQARPVDPDAPLPRVGGAVIHAVASAAPIGPAESPDLITIEVRPAYTFYVQDGGYTVAAHATAETVGDGLREAGVVLLPADLTEPPPSAPLAAGRHVLVRRAIATNVTVDGQRHEFRTQAATVGAALSERRIALADTDRVTPPLDTPLREAPSIQVVRVAESTISEDEPIAYETKRVADADLEIGNQTTVKTGAPGIRRREYLMQVEDGRMVSRTLQREWVEREPTTEEIHYGTKVVLHAVPGDGGLQYTRVLRVYATWYSPASAGKPRSSPGYGRTAIGLPARRGVIAVDPSVIPLGTRVYIPGYGVAIAGDVGGGVRGNMIDLAYGDDEVKDWVSRYLDIYILP